MSHGQYFTGETKGVDVVNAFADQVKNRTFLITGADKGQLPGATAQALAQGNAAALIFLGKFREEIQPVIDDINHRFPKVKTIFITTDFAKLASVRDAADKLRKLEVPIDGIIGNPTLFAAPWSTTEEGIESHFQINYLGHFLLVNLIIPAMPKGSRVVMISSSIRPESPAPKFDDPNFQNGATYHSLDGYAQSMFANILFAKGLAKSCTTRSITAFSSNPGNIKTNVQTYVSPEQISSWLQKKKREGEDLPLLLQQAPKSIQQGSASLLRALLDPILKDHSGAFLDNCQVLALPKLDFPAGEPSANQLWKKSEELVGEQFKWP